MNDPARAPLTIDLDAAPDAAVREAVLGPLRAFNRTRAPDARWGAFALRLRDAAGQVVTGGLYATYGLDWCYIDLLVVPDERRGQGLGTRLMRRAEDEARRCGCVGVWLRTFSFQARPFYEALGYELFGELADHPAGASCFFMRKRL